MKITNTSAKGKWIHVKINGFSYKKWVAGYDSIILAEVTSKSQLNLNAHEEALIHVTEHTGVDPDPTPEFYYKVQAARVGSTGGTTSLSATSVMIADGLNVSFTVYPESSYYLSAYTINGVAHARTSVSATTTYTITNITQDQNISVAFARFGN